MPTQITCIVPRGSDRDRRIEAVGGLGWRKNEDTVIREIEDGHEFFVEVDLTRCVVVVIENEGRKYLRTDPEETKANRLLTLPRCT